MKILKEAKEDLPISFITDFISNGWDAVGYLKADVEAISSVYKGTKNIVKYIEDLTDAYLICIGQMQNLLQEDKYIDYPEESKLTVESAQKAKLAEDIQVIITDSQPTDSTILADLEPAVEVSEPKVSDIVVEPCDSCAAVNEPVDIEIVPDTKPTALSGEPFEYYVDFDEPDMSEPVDPDFFDRLTGKKN